jgi:hypothetical protein
MSEDKGEIRPVTDEERRQAMDCLRCGMVVRREGPIKLRVGGVSGGWNFLVGNLAELGEATMELDLYSCANCGHIEFRVARDGG